MSQMDREMYLYECTVCDVVFGVATEFEDQAIIVCPVCKGASHIHDAGCAMATITREPEGGEYYASIHETNEGPVSRDGMHRLQTDLHDN